MTHTFGGFFSCLCIDLWLRPLLLLPSIILLWSSWLIAWSLFCCRSSGDVKGGFTHSLPRPCRSPAMPCRWGFRMCLSHLILRRTAWSEHGMGAACCVWIGLKATCCYVQDTPIYVWGRDVAVRHQYAQTGCVVPVQQVPLTYSFEAHELELAVTLRKFKAEIQSTWTFTLVRPLSTSCFVF
jgi:hypothetical protein